MKGAAKGSPAASAEKSSTGKKLVQARLPFKILSSPVSAASEKEPRKRRLSSQSDSRAPKVLCTSETKENALIRESSIVISDDEGNHKESTSKEGNPALNPVVKLDNIDDLIKNSKDEHGRIVLSPKTPNPSKNRSTPFASRSSGKGNTFVIKLPLSSKKKRKLSEKLNASRSPERSSAEETPEDVKTKKKFRTSPEDDDARDVVEIADDEEDTLSANICLQVTNMSEDSVLHPTPVKRVSVGKCEAVLPEEAANDSELFSAMKKRKKSERPLEEPSSTLDTDNEEGGDDKEALSKDTDSDAISKESKHHPDDDEMQTTAGSNKEAKTTSPDKDVDSDDSENIAATPLRGVESAAKSQQKSITPRQLLKQKEREEKLKQREEERLQKQKEKEEIERQRKKEREEKEEQRRKEREEKEKQRRKEKEEKEEQRRKEKEEKEKKRLAEIEAKNEERRKKEEVKEEERRKKEEEKRKKEQEKEEAENKKRKAAEVFTKFFVQSKPPAKELTEEDQSSMDSEAFRNSTFMPFQIKGDMKLAPLIRRTLDGEAKAKLDEILENSPNQSIPKEELYVSCLKSGKISPRKDTKTWLTDDDGASDCLVIEDELEGAGQKIDDASKPMQKYRAKFLYFHENQRPPYYGTWRKKSSFVKPRRPFATDTKCFDYEVDSDDEWEEEEPGESLHGSDDEKESEDEYEVDNEFFVPHGHLSDEELQNEDELDNSPEMQKAKLKMLQQEFAQEMKKKTERIKPRLVGIVWQDENGNKPEMCSSVIWESLNKRAMIFSEPPVMTEPEKNESEANSPVQEKKMPKKCLLTEEQVKDLIKLVHGNRHKREFMLREFQAFMSKGIDEGATPVEYTKASFKEQVDKIAEWAVTEDPEKKKKKLCWMVFQDVLKQYGMEGLSNINRWEYILQPKRILHEPAKAVDSPTTEVASSDKEKSTTVKKKKKKKHLPAITKFTTVIAKEKDKDTPKAISKDTSNGVADDTIDISEDNPDVDAKKDIENIAKPDDASKSIDCSKLVPSAINANSKPSSQVKKRVPLLMSVPRGQQIPEKEKNALISDFLKKRPDTVKDPPDAKAAGVATHMEVETITID